MLGGPRASVCLIFPFGARWTARVAATCGGCLTTVLRPPSEAFPHASNRSLEILYAQWALTDSNRRPPDGRRRRPPSVPSRPLGQGVRVPVAASERGARLPGRRSRGRVRSSSNDRFAPDFRPISRWKPKPRSRSCGVGQAWGSRVTVGGVIFPGAKPTARHEHRLTKELEMETRVVYGHLQTARPSRSPWRFTLSSVRIPPSQWSAVPGFGPTWTPVAAVGNSMRIERGGAVPSRP